MTSLRGADATKTAILASLSHLVRSLQPGDVGVFQFSGHGTFLCDKNGDEDDGRDEAIVPVDAGALGRGLILDDHLYASFLSITRDAYLVFISDCCHSGTIWRNLPIGDAPRERSVSPERLTSGGEDRWECAERLRQMPAKPRKSTTLFNVVHFSACSDREQAADIMAVGGYCGAFSNVAIPAFREAIKAGKSYRDAWKAIRKKLPSRDYRQTPGINGSKRLCGRRIFS